MNNEQCKDILGRLQCNATSSIELWRSDPRKAFLRHLEFIQCLCTGIDASLDKLRKGMEEQGLFSDASEAQ